MYMSAGWTDQSLAMNDDGIIYYKAPRSYRRVFKELEKETGLDFERTSKRRKAEIICTYTELETAGVCQLRGDKFFVKTDPEFKKVYGTYHVETHEIGHALGLSHDPNYYSAMQTGWDNLPTFFTTGDYMAIDNLFF